MVATLANPFLIFGAKRDLPAWPAGVILWYFGVFPTAPTGWTNVEIGAGFGYLKLYGSGNTDPLNTYVSQTLPQFVINPAGSHSGSASNFVDQPSQAGINSPVGDHDHGGAATGDRLPQKDQWKFHLAKCANDTDVLPDTMCFFKYDSDDITAPFTRINPTTLSGDGYVRHTNWSTGSLGETVADLDVDITITEDGAHNHGGQKGGFNGGADDAFRGTVLEGGHSHGGVQTMSVGINDFALVMNAWWASGGTSNRNTGPVVALYESETSLPEGWALMSDFYSVNPADRFLMIAKNLANGGTQKNGNNQLTLSFTTSTDGGHDHASDFVANQDRSSAFHANTAGAHGHVITINPSTLDHKPNRISYVPIVRTYT